MKRITLLVQFFMLYAYSNLTAQPTDGLIARFPMNQVIVDVEGGHNVDLIGSIVSIADRNGNTDCAIDFKNGHGIIQDGIDFSSSSLRPISISLWFKRNSLTIPWVSTVFSKNFSSGDIGDFSIMFFNENAMTINAREFWMNFSDQNEVYFDLEWHHLIVSVMNSYQSIYLDGDLLQISDYSISGEPHDGQVLIGESFDWDIDDIFIYDRILTGEEVSQLFTAESDCGTIDSVNNRKITGTLFNDLNRNAIRDVNEQNLQNFDLVFDPTNTSVNTNSNGFFQTILDKNQIHNLNLSPDSNAVWTFTQPQNPIDLSNYPDYIFDLGLIGVHKRPKKEVLITGTLFSDQNGNNAMDGNDYLLPDYNLQLTPSNFILTSNSAGYFEQSLDSGAVQTLNVPISEQLYWEFSVTPEVIDLINYSGDTLDLGLIGIKPKEKIMVANFNTSFPATIAHSRNGECSVILKNDGNVTMNGNLKVTVAGQQLITKFIYTSNHSLVTLNDSTIQFIYPVDNLIPLDSLITGFTIFSQAPANSKVHINYEYMDVSGYNISGSYEVTIVAPHDPNYIAVDHEKIYKQFITDFNQLAYTVHFQNMGSAPAENVVIRQIVPNELKSDYIYVIGASAPVRLDKVQIVESTELVWTFDNINLAPIAEDSIKSTGYVSFSMFPASLEKDDSIVMDADIYFDSQPAIKTNDAITSLICKGAAGQNMVDFQPLGALCFGDMSGGVLMNANIDTTSMSIIFNNAVQIPYTKDTVHLLAGNYSITTIDELGCSQSQFVVIKQPSKLNSSIIDLANNKKELLVGGGTPPYSIMWNNGYTGYELDNLPVGTNIYTIADANGCTLEGLFEKSILKINESSTYQDIKVYPNPVKSMINIEWIGEDFKSVIIDLQGREIKSFEMSNNKVILDISELGARVYLLKLTSSKGSNKIIRVTKL